MAQELRTARLRRSVASLGVSPDELVGIAEVAETFGVSKQTAVKYSQRADFPEPLDRLASGPVWRRDDVEAWGKETLPLATGRPPREAVVKFVLGGVPPPWVSPEAAATLAAWLQERALGPKAEAGGAQKLGSRIDAASHAALTTKDDAPVELAGPERELLIRVLTQRKSDTRAEAKEFARLLADLRDYSPKSTAT
jgi:predicted DNA-binding transcriptional regulator AlpA